MYGNCVQKVPSVFCSADLSHSDDLRFVPSAASRRWNIALIECCRGCSRGQRGELVEERSEPLCAAGTFKTLSVLSFMRSPSAHQVYCSSPPSDGRQPSL